MLFSHDMSDVVQRAALGSKQGPLSLTDKVCADLSHSDGAQRTREETRAVCSSAFVVWDSVTLRLSPNLPLQLLAALVAEQKTGDLRYLRYYGPRLLLALPFSGLCANR